MARTRELFYKIFYSSSFTAVFLLLIAFCGVAPADKLYESWQRRRVIDIIIIAAAWVLTALIAAFLYGTRLYTTRSILRDIPKTFLPIEREDLPGRNVHHLVRETYACSAVIAYQAKPRAKRIEFEVQGAGERMLVISKQMKQHHHHHSLTAEERRLLEPKWGSIAHAGWQSPASADMAGLEYARVADELIDLIEAKAVGMAPNDPLATPLEDGTTPPDARFIDALTRPEGIGMRRYLAQLADLGVIPDSTLTDEFLLLYEHSRFSGKPMTEPDFQSMMRLFAELLRNMQPVEQNLVDFSSDDDFDHDNEAESSLKGKGPSVLVNGHIPDEPKRAPSTPSVRSEKSMSSVLHNNIAQSSSPAQQRSSSLASSSQESLQHYQPSQAYAGYSGRSALPTFTSAAASGSGTRGNSRSRPELLTRSTGHTSFHSATSIRSSRSAASGESGSQGSVIRLTRADAGNREVGRGDLPYEIDIRGFER